ncbi:unnamed protein product [Calypogeia fissa]
MQRLRDSWGSCFPCSRRKDRNRDVGTTSNGKGGPGSHHSNKERSRSSYEEDSKNEVELEEEQGGDTVSVPKWEGGRTAPGDDQISKPKPVRVHLRRPSSMGSEYKVGLVYDERMQAHYNAEDPFHPEKPERISAIYESLEAAGIVDKCELVAAREATTSELSCVHSKKHIDAMRVVSNKAQEKSSRISLAKKYNSVYFNEGSSLSALLAAGSCVELSIKIAKGELGAGAAVVRPPGHHAEADAAMGFCLFNTVAIAAHNLVHCQPALGIKKVLIVDWDVHHGNGTQHMFWKDPFVLYFSIHRYDYGFFYPTSEDGDSDKIGEGAGKGFNVNVPWQRRGYGDLDYLAVFDHLLMPIAQKFNPDMVFISAGFDSAQGDPLGGCKITPAGYNQMTQRLMTLAGGRIVLALEGGYNLNSIAASYLACMKALLGDPCEDKLSLELRSSTWSLIKDVRKKLLPYWSSLSKPLPEQPPEHFEVAEDAGLDSAYQDSVSVSEEESEEDDFDPRRDTQTMAEQHGAGLQLEENPGDLLSQLRTQEARLSSVQKSEIEAIAGGISALSVKGEEGNDHHNATSPYLVPGEHNAVVPYQEQLEHKGAVSPFQAAVEHKAGVNPYQAAVEHNNGDVEDPLPGEPSAVSWEELLDESSKHYKDP